MFLVALKGDDPDLFKQNRNLSKEIAGKAVENVKNGQHRGISQSRESVPKPSVITYHSDRYSFRSFLYINF